jgi:hypothetical protein
VKKIFLVMIFVGGILSMLFKTDKAEPVKTELSALEKEELELQAMEKRTAELKAERERIVAETFKHDSIPGAYAPVDSKRQARKLSTSTDEQIKIAEVVCKIMNDSNALTEPCSYSLWDKEIVLYSNASTREALKLCQPLNKLLDGKLNKWTIKFYSPFSGNHTIAQCRL